MGYCRVTRRVHTSSVISGSAQASQWCGIAGLAADVAPTRARRAGATRRREPFIVGLRSHGRACRRDRKSAAGSGVLGAGPARSWISGRTTKRGSPRARVSGKWSLSRPTLGERLRRPRCGRRAPRSIRARRPENSTSSRMASRGLEGRRDRGAAPGLRSWPFDVRW